MSASKAKTAFDKWLKDNPQYSDLNSAMLAIVYYAGYQVGYDDGETDNANNTPWYS